MHGSTGSQHPGYNYDIEIDEQGKPKPKTQRKGWRYYTGLSRGTATPATGH